jgi:hypothetical protein
MVNLVQSLTLKLKQASAVLGVPPKALQNLVQLGVIRPVRRNSVCWFDTNLLLEAKVAFYLKETLGSSSDLLARFTEAFSKNHGKAKMADLGDVCLSSRPLNGTSAVEIKIPVRSLARELVDQIPLASVYKDLLRVARGLDGRRASCGAPRKRLLIFVISQRNRF